MHLVNSVWARQGFFSTLPKPQYFPTLKFVLVLLFLVLLDWMGAVCLLKEYTVTLSFTFTILVFYSVCPSLCLCLSLCVFLCLPVLGFVVLNVWGRARLKRTPCVWLQKGQRWLLAGFSSSEKLTEDRHSVHLSSLVCWLCFYKMCVFIDFCACSWMLVHVCNCKSAPGRKNLREMDNCVEVCSELNSCLIICWHVVPEWCGWL